MTAEAQPRQGVGQYRAVQFFGERGQRRGKRRVEVAGAAHDQPGVPGNGGGDALQLWIGWYQLRALDRGVGRVLDTLKANGLEDNTLVFFTSDNGGAHYLGLPDINRPFRGWKLTFFEGGIHVPFFVKWPAGLPRGKIYSKPVAQVDIFATAAAAAGVPLPKDRVIDGVDLVPFVAEDRPDRPHERMFWRSGHYRAVIVGDWKLHVTQRPKKMWLFNLANDPTEQVNLAPSEPAKVKELLSVLNEMNAQMKKPIWMNLVEIPVMIDHTLKERDPGPEAQYIYWAN